MIALPDNNQAPKIVRSISTRNLSAPHEKNKETKMIPEIQVLGYFLGVAEKFSEEPNKFDVTVVQYKFHGEFMAYTVEGEKTQSSSAYFPSLLADMIVRQMDDSEGASIELAFEIWVKPSSNNASGYTYEIKPLIQQVQPSRLDRLASLLAGQPAIAHEG